MPREDTERKKPPAEASKKNQTKKAASRKPKKKSRQNAKLGGDKKATESGRGAKEPTAAAKADKGRKKITAAEKADKERKKIATVEKAPSTTAAEESCAKENEAGEYENLSTLMKADAPPQLIPADMVSLRIPVKPAKAQPGEPKDEILQPYRGGATLPSEYVAPEMNYVQSSSNSVASSYFTDELYNTENDLGSYMAPRHYRPHSQGITKKTARKSKRSRSSTKKSSK
ncbi:hypothetical protein AAVH_07044 [Aphelenchoides avenae]|nr:hypothetical protein AAVH_07044 [Aphelenchus avenae]